MTQPLNSTKNHFRQPHLSQSKTDILIHVGYRFAHVKNPHAESFEPEVAEGTEVFHPGSKATNQLQRKPEFVIGIQFAKELAGKWGQEDALRIRG